MQIITFVLEETRSGLFHALPLHLTCRRHLISDDNSGLFAPSLLLRRLHFFFQEHQVRSRKHQREEQDDGEGKDEHEDNQYINDDKNERNEDSYF